MRLTSKGRYAVAAMIDLAKHSANGPVPLAMIADRQCLSLSYLEQLFRRLREAGLVRSVRGPGGGYLLGRPAEKISIAEIIHAVNETVQTTACSGGEQGCMPDGSRRDAHPLWTALGEQIERFLQNVTLAQACEGKIPGASDAGDAKRAAKVQVEFALS